MLRTKRWRLVFANVVLAITVGVTSAAEAKCFDPLSVPSRRDPNDFRDLNELVLPPKARGFIKIQHPSIGIRGINIDYYWVDFTRPKDITGKEFFKAVRQKFSDFATGKRASFAFGPYETSDLATNLARGINLEKWQKDNPTDALMSFKLASIFPWASLKAGQARLGEKNGDVQVICASDLDFVFATVDDFEFDELEPSRLICVVRNRTCGC